MNSRVDEDGAPDQHELLTNQSEILYRQVHPNWVHDGIPSSQAFAPTKKDEGMLSVTRGSMTTAEATYKHYAEILKKASAGTWGLTVGEARDASLSSFDDPQEDTPAHGFIDFRHLGRGPTGKIGKLLMAKARDRGRLHPPS